MHKLYLLMLLAPLCAGSSPSSDTVNERIPVSKVELERHWGVDCTSLSTKLASFTQWQENNEGCHLDPSLQRQLQLCAFIYQPPGASTGHKCPDYQGAVNSLKRATPSADCPRLEKLMKQGEPCASERLEN